MEADARMFDVDCACGMKLHALSDLFAGSCPACSTKETPVISNEEKHAG